MAVFPVQPGNPDYGTGGTSQYIPAIYSALLVKKFYPKTLFSKIANTDYEGDIKEQGDTVYIRTRPTIETFKYKKGMVLPVQNPESAYVTLKIDQGEGFSFALDRVDEFQADIKLMDVWGEDAAEQMKQVMDRNVLVQIAAKAASQYTGGALANVDDYDASGLGFSNYTQANGAIINGDGTNTTTRGSVISLGGATGATATSANTGDEITALVLKYGRYLDENNAPEEGRYVVFPTWVGSVLKSMASNNFGLAYATGQNMANLLKGAIPSIDRFEIYFTNNYSGITGSETDAAPVIFGHKYAMTYATQITESRIIDNPFSFGKMMQGLQVYGAEIIKPSLLGVDFIKNA